MQRYTIFFIIVNVLHVSGGFFRPSSGAQKLYTQHLVCARLACCGSSKQAETCRALSVIKNIV